VDETSLEAGGLKPRRRRGLETEQRKENERWGFHLGDTALAAPASSSATALLCYAMKGENNRGGTVGDWEEITMLCYCYELVDGP
jgi:hypothetical protein